MNSDRNIAMKMDALAIVKLIRIVIWSLTMAIDFTRLLVPVNISIKYMRCRKLDIYFICLHIYFRGNDHLLDCIVLNVGSGSSNPKTVSGKIGYKCPSYVDKYNWFGTANHGDSFSVAQSGAQVIVTRLDHNGGWGMNLRFECCNAGKSNPNN